MSLHVLTAHVHILTRGRPLHAPVPSRVHHTVLGYTGTSSRGRDADRPLGYSERDFLESNGHPLVPLFSRHQRHIGAGSGARRVVCVPILGGHCANRYRSKLTVFARIRLGDCLGGGRESWVAKKGLRIFVLIQQGFRFAESRVLFAWLVYAESVGWRSARFSRRYYRKARMSCRELSVATGRRDDFSSDEQMCS